VIRAGRTPACDSEHVDIPAGRTVFPMAARRDPNLYDSFSPTLGDQERPAVSVQRQAPRAMPRDQDSSRSSQGPPSTILEHPPRATPQPGQHPDLQARLA
jgi:hypothetical protein